jgi:hypothetical protein
VAILLYFAMATILSSIFKIIDRACFSYPVK